MASASVRRRIVGEDAKQESEPVIARSESVKGKQGVPVAKSSDAWFIGCLLLAALIGTVVVCGYESRPKVKGVEAPASEFSAGRAHEKVVALSDGFQVHTWATDEAGDWMWSEVQSLVQLAEKKGMAVEVDRWRGTGAINHERTHGNVTYVYNDVENIAIKICGMGGCGSPAPSVLVNSHYDSAVDSPGGTDAAGMVGVMLEVASNIIHTGQPLNHSVVLLFNGAEEPYLLAAHAFLTHKWWDDIEVFINLEASGAGGSNLLFRTSPGHNWLGHAYKQAVRNPFVFSGSQDIFERDLVPSNTDFVIWNDVGGKPGYDFANYRHGQVYHTMKDNAARCTHSFLQHMGENTLDLVRYLATTSDITEDHSESNVNASKLIMFDVLGQMVLVLDEKVANSLYTILFVILLRRLSFSSDRRYIGKMLFLIVLGVLVAGGLSYGIGFALSLILPLRWYGYLGLIPGIFVAPATIGYFSTQMIGYKEAASWDSAYTAISLFYMIITILFSAMRVRMSYVPGIATLGALLAAHIQSMRNIVRPVRFGIVFGASLFGSFPAAACALEVFTAIMGRAGVQKRGDVIIGVLASTITTLVMAVPFGPAVTSSKSIYKGTTFALIAITILSWLYAAQLEGSYSAEYPKRVIVVDTKFQVNKGEEEAESSIFMSSADFVPLGGVDLWPGKDYQLQPDVPEQFWGNTSSHVLDFLTPNAHELLCTDKLEVDPKAEEEDEFLSQKVVLAIESVTNTEDGLLELRLFLRTPLAELLVIKARGNFLNWSLPVPVSTINGTTFIRSHFTNRSSRDSRITLEMKPEDAPDFAVDVFSIKPGGSSRVEMLRASLPTWAIFQSYQLVTATQTYESFNQF